MRTLVIVFDDSRRLDTTGIYCQSALSDLGGRSGFRVVHVSPEEFDRGTDVNAGLTLFVDDGLDYPIPEAITPTAWWAIDTHLSFERTCAKACSAEFVFAAQKPGATAFQQAGIRQATWLPLACAPDTHARHEIRKRYDMCFLGNMTSQRRVELLQTLKEHVPNTHVGRQWFNAMARMYSASKIVFNCSTLGDLNMRVFETLCSGSLLLTDDLSGSGQEELFQDGVHLATYASAEEMLDKARFYLREESIREKIAAQGRREVLARHTYRHRMEAVLTACWGPLRTWSRTSVAVGGSAPKDRSYFEWDRPDVLVIVPETARNVLDVGCGGGRLGASIKRRQEARVTGIEQDAEAADRARSRLDAVHIGSIEADDIPFESGEFDCIICADILEHLSRPADALKRLRRWLTPDGHLVLSIPNVRHHTVVRSLIRGNWTYESAGLLDDTHLRFFTRREIEKLLYRCAFQLEELRMVPGEGHREWIRNGRPRDIAFGDVTFHAATTEDAEEFFAYQYLVRARPNETRDRGLTSIILVTHNQLKFTRACIDSICFRTDEPYELIVVDNASTDGTPDYLSSLADALVLLNTENRGFPAAVNQGVTVARGENILLLNNDTLVTTGWLDRMLEALHSGRAIGLVGPVSNSVSGEQQVAVDYRRVEDLDGFAWDWGQQHRHERVSVDRLVGFCLLIKREVVERIGGFDERFGIGNFEDDDYCRRALAAGYRAVIARDAFVHHFGSASFRGSGVNLGELLRKNRQIFDDKWRPDTPSQGTASNTNSDAPSSGNLSSRQEILSSNAPSPDSERSRSAVRLSACLIVRDNESTIEDCLRSIRPWVDEVVVVDTGSKDRTPELCRQLGAQVHEWAWQDDFAAARNVSLSHARGDWIFWMDSDDTLPADCGRQLRELADADHPGHIMGFVAQVHCPGPTPQETTVVDHIKLIRNRPEIRFEFRIHEQVLPSIRRLGGDVAWTDLYVIHSGSDRSAAGHQRKLERDFRLLHRELEERGRHPFVLFNLGMTYADANQNEEAIRFLDECLSISTPQESHVRKAYALLVGTLQKSDRWAEAQSRAQDGLRHFPADKELLFRSAVGHQQAGHMDRAVRLYQQILNEQVDRHFTSVDVGILDVKARHNLAILYEAQEDFAAAANQWRSILARDKGHRPAWRRLGELAIRVQQWDEFQTILDETSSNAALRPISRMLAASALDARGDVATALRILEETHREHPDDLDVLNDYCRALFTSADLERAEQMLTVLAERCPDDASAHLNLATMHLRCGHLVEAKKSVERAASLRPDHRATTDLMRQIDTELQVRTRSRPIVVERT